MSCVYNKTDKRSGNTYAYESTSYRDPETGKVRTRQVYLGRIDPLTGELIPKGEGGRRRRSPSDRAVEAAAGGTRARIAELEREVEELERELEGLRSEARARDDCVREVLAAADRYRAAVGA